MQKFEINKTGNRVASVTSNQYATMWGWEIVVAGKPALVCEQIYHARFSAEEDLNHVLKCFANAKQLKEKKDGTS